MSNNSYTRIAQGILVSKLEDGDAPDSYSIHPFLVNLWLTLEIFLDIVYEWGHWDVLH